MRKFGIVFPMNFKIKRKFVNEKAKAIKKPKTAFNDDSDESNDETFEQEMNKKAAKINKLLDSQQEVIVDESEQPKQEATLQKGPKYLNQILQSAEQRKNDRLILLQSNIDRNIKNSSGLIFESEEYKSEKAEVDRLRQDDTEEQPIEKNNLPQNSTPTFFDKIKHLYTSRITQRELLEYKQRFFDRHPDLKQEQL